MLQAGGLLEQCVQLPARSATDEELLRVHTAEHLKHVAAATQAVADSPDDRSLQEPHGVDAIYYHASTERAARAAAGCVLQATSGFWSHRFDSPNLPATSARGPITAGR